jgi:hypothetical protein
LVRDTVEFFCFPNTSSWGLSKGLTLLTGINRTLCGQNICRIVP